LAAVENFAVIQELDSDCAAVVKHCGLDFFVDFRGSPYFVLCFLSGFASNWIDPCKYMDEDIHWPQFASHKLSGPVCSIDEYIAGPVCAKDLEPCPLFVKKYLEGQRAKRRMLVTGPHENLDADDIIPKMAASAIQLQSLALGVGHSVVKDDCGRFVVVDVGEEYGSGIYRGPRREVSAFLRGMTYQKWGYDRER